MIDKAPNDAQFAADLSTHSIDADGSILMTLANLKQLGQDAAAAAAASGGQAVSGTADLRDMTAQERGDFQTAVAAIRNVQVRAKEKYEESHRDKLDAYYVGQKLDTRPQVRSAGAAVWGIVGTTDTDGNAVTPKDTLPGLDATRLARLKADLGEYADVQTKQSGAQAAASEARGTFKDQCDQITRRRRVQQAIDAERPHSPANTALRKRVGLPAERAMS